MFDCSSGMNNVIETPELCVQLLLDSSYLPSFQLATLSDHQKENMELYSREIVYICNGWNYWNDSELDTREHSVSYCT